MNLALTTLSVLIFALPGIILRKSYYSEDFSTNYRKTNLTEDIFWAVIPSLFIHSLFRLILISFSSFDFNFNVIGYLLAGLNDTSAVRIVFENLKTYHFEIAFYFSLIILFCYWTGNKIREIIISKSWDIKYPRLRFQNEWYYFISGRYTDIAYGKGSYEKLEFVIADVLVYTGNKNILYKGFANSYFLNKKGSLDSIVLAFPSKKEYDIVSKNEFVEIPSDFLIIDYKHIININFSYFEETK